MAFTRPFLTLTTFLLFATQTSTTQSIWNPIQTSKEVTVQYLRPSMKNTIFPNISGYGINVTTRFPFRETKTIIFQLPYYRANTHYTTSFSPFTTENESQSSAGNAYLGIESRNEETAFTTNFGIYLPTISDEKILASLMGTISDVDQYEAVVPNFLTVTFRGNSNRIKLNDEFGILTRLGISGMIKTKKRFPTEDSFEALLNYAIQPAVTIESFNMLMGFSGKYIITESGSFEEKILHQAGIAISYRIERVRLELFGRLPLNNSLSELMENVYGAAITIEFH